MTAPSIARLLAVALLAMSVPAAARFVDRSPTAPLPPGDYLTSEQIKALVAGKTLSIPRLTPQLMGTPQSPEIHYYAPHGTAYFMVRPKNLAPTIGRGTWSSDNNRLCTQGFKYAPCFGIRRTAAGQFEAVYTSHVVFMGRDHGDHWPITIESGDAQNIRPQINTTYPYDFANMKPSE